ncbi:MAG: AEC family transporter [Methanobacteriaceae archaeon]|nr:AEC family transporter [Methanobacteriaceae archaeon]
MNTNSIEVILIPAIMILLGYILKNNNVLHETDNISLNKIVINISLPSLIFVNLLSETITPSMVQIPLIGLVISGICALIAFIFSWIKGYSKEIMFSIIISSSLINTAFIGYPVILEVFGHTGLINGIFFDLSTTILFVIFSIILLLIYGGDYKDIVKHSLLFPPLWAIILGVICNQWHVTLGNVILKILTYFGNSTTALIMISLGLSLNLKEIKKYLNIACTSSVIRLILGPLIAISLLSLFGINGLMKDVIILDAGISSAMLGIVLAINYKLDVPVMTACIFTSTILSIFTLPVIISLF